MYALWLPFFLSIIIRSWYAEKCYNRADSGFKDQIAIIPPIFLLHNAIFHNAWSWHQLCSVTPQHLLCLLVLIPSIPYLFLPYVGMDIIYCLITLFLVNHHANLWIVKLSWDESQTMQTMPPMSLLFPYSQFKVHTFSLGVIEFDV